jgi:arginase family enzyme
MVCFLLVSIVAASPTEGGGVHTIGSGFARIDLMLIVAGCGHVSGLLTRWIISVGFHTVPQWTPRTLDWLQPSYDYGYNVVTMKQFRQRGLCDVVAQIKEVLAGRPVYVTFDLDCLGPSIGPAVSNLEPGERGFDIDDAVGLLHAVRGMNIIGGDIVCMMPTKDSPNQITALTASVIMISMISLIAETVQLRRT